MKKVKNQAVRVHSVSQEYWYIKRHLCICGGHFEKEMQSLIQHDGKPSDRLITKCSDCGLRREFIFDISTFYGDENFMDQLQLFKLLEQAQDIDERMRAKLTAVLGSPVANAVNTILKCGKEDDHLALDWLESAIQYARSAKDR